MVIKNHQIRLGDPLPSTDENLFFHLFASKMWRKTDYPASGRRLPSRRTYNRSTSLRVQNSFWIWFWLRFWIFLGISFLAPIALYLQQFGTRICHFAWYLLDCGMVTLHFAWYLLQAMFAFHFAWYLRRFGTSTFHLHGICYILVLQPFMWVSWEFL